MHPQPADAPATEDARRARLDEVRREATDLLHSGDALTGREILGCMLGGLLLGAGLLLSAVGLTGDADGTGRAVLVGLGALLLAGAWLAFRPWLRRRRDLLRGVRALRQEERSLVAGLPDGGAGRSVLATYYRERFSNPAAVLVMVALAVVVLAQLLR